MSASSKSELQTLYVEIADLLAQRNQLSEAADHYALAMYYAKRINNQAVVDLCREQILAYCPGHVAVRENNAPLFFAQLLMRYPAEEARTQLAQLKESMPEPAPVEPISWTAPPDRHHVMASSEPAPVDRPSAAPQPISSFSQSTPVGLMNLSPTPSTPVTPVGISNLQTPVTPAGLSNLAPPRLETGPSTSGLASLFGPVASTTTWAQEVSLPIADPMGSSTQPAAMGMGHAGFERHHPLTFDGPAGAVLGSRASTDFEMTPAPPRMPVRNFWGWLEPLGAVVAVAGVAAMAFFAVKLYPEVKKIDLKPSTSMIDAAVQEAVAKYLTFSADPSDPNMPVVIENISADATVPVLTSAPGPRPETPSHPEAAVSPASATSAAVPRELPSIPSSALPAPTERGWSAPAKLSQVESAPKR